MDGRGPGMPGMNEDVTREVEQFLYREARLLDERRFHEWLELLADDVHYWMGSRSNRYPKTSKAIAILDPERYVEDDLTKADELAILDEDKADARPARRPAGYRHGLGRGPAVAHAPPDHQYRGGARRRGVGGQGLLEFHGLPEPGGDRAGYSMSVPGGMCCGGSPAPGRSPAARSSSTRMCCWPKTSASSFD